MAEPLEETTKKEFEKTPEAAKQAAKATNYFDLLGQQFGLTWKVTKKAAKIVGTAAVLGAAAYTGFTLFGIDAPITMAGLIAGDWLAKWKNKEKITYKDTMVKGIAGAALGGFLHYLFPAVHYVGDQLGNLVSGAGASSFYTTATKVASKSAILLGAGFPAFIKTEDTLYRILDPKYKPLDWDNFKKSWKKAALVIGLPACLNLNFVPKEYQIPGAAAIATLYGFTSAKPKETPKEAEKAATPQTQYALPGMPQPAYR